MAKKGANKKWCERYKAAGTEATNKARNIARDARRQAKQRAKKESLA